MTFELLSGVLIQLDPLFSESKLDSCERMTDSSFAVSPQTNSNEMHVDRAEKSDSIQFKSILCDWISGGLSGLCSYSMTLPLEVIQTRLQSTVDNERIKNLKPIAFTSKYCPQINIQLKNKYLTIGKDICIKDGWRGFFKGYVPLVVGIFPSRSIYFGINTQTRRIFESIYGQQNYETIKIALSAVMGSITASTLTSPIWVIKTHLQLKRKLLQKHVTMKSIFGEIYHTQGFKGFYRGLTSCYYGSIETMIYWLLYEQFKKKIQDFRRNKDRELSALDSAGASIIAKTLSIMIGYPHEVVRTRMRQGLVDVNGKLIYNEFWSTIVKIYKKEGFIRIYSALNIHILRQVTNATISMVAFEQIRNLLNKLGNF